MRSDQWEAASVYCARGAERLELFSRLLQNLPRISHHGWRKRSLSNNPSRLFLFQQSNRRLTAWRIGLVPYLTLTLWLFLLSMCRLLVSSHLLSINKSASRCIFLWAAAWSSHELVVPIWFLVFIMIPAAFIQQQTLYVPFIFGFLSLVTIHQIFLVKLLLSDFPSEGFQKFWVCF